MQSIFTAQNRTAYRLEYRQETFILEKMAVLKKNLEAGHISTIVGIHERSRTSYVKCISYLKVYGEDTFEKTVMASGKVYGM